MLPPAPDEWTIFEAAHLLRRAGFGGSPAEIKALHALGRHRAVDRLLAPAEPAQAFPPPAWAERGQALADLKARADEFRALRRGSRELSPEAAERQRREFRQKEQRENRRQVVEAQGWWFRRMLATKAPLREKMTLFWHDHFATSVQKVRQPALMVMQNELFRRHATGSFRELVRAVAADPAMTIYLDRQSSRKGKPNENFAREVMELFTLGEGNYSEHDIKEAARAFTGVQFNRLAGTVSRNPRQWDDGEKTIFGKTGKFDGDGVIDLLFEQKAAARLVPTKLWEYFVAENPPQEGIDALAASFRAADFRIEPLLREIFRSQAFYAAKVIRNQIKSPIQYLVQMLRELELSDPPAARMLAAQQQLGQVLFMPPNVAGWDWGKAWINTNTLLSRYNVAGFITKGSQEAAKLAANDEAPMMEMMMEPGRKPERKAAAMARLPRDWAGPDFERIAPRALREDPEQLVDSLVFRFFQSPLGGKERETFTGYARSKKGAVFTNQEVGELCHLMLSTPHYQLA
jgi:uncharacterized protein (DUF1800 family)